MNKVQLQQTIPESLAGKRLDQALASLLPDYSRSRIKQWIINQQVKVDAQHWAPTDKVKGGETVDIQAEIPEAVSWTPQAIDLDVIYEDDDVIVINKPVGLVVHPAVGHHNGTLVNAILHRYPECAQLPRAGVVHRLDKDTSGLMMIARSIPAHTALVNALQKREIKREYLALVRGELTGGGTVNAPVGRHPVNRVKMAVVGSGKEAVTHYRIHQRLQGHTLVVCKLESGRTHQIRVHMAHIGYNIIGDPLYGGRMQFSKHLSEQTRAYIRHFKRQALHAYQLGFAHPVTGEEKLFTAALPKDMAKLCEHLQGSVV